MPEMQKDEVLVRRLQATSDRKRPRANQDDDHVGVRPRAMQEQYVEKQERGAAPTSDGNRGRSSVTEM